MRNGFFPGTGPEYVNRASASASVPASCGSFPAITDKTNPQSSALRARGPILSIEYESAMAPWRLTRPKVGRKPDTPQNAEGQIIDPHVSVPMAKAASPAATIAPEPLEEPQVQQRWFQGFFVGPVREADA